MTESLPEPHLMQPPGERYLAWKCLVPCLYDSFICHKLTWPCLSCRWGPVLDIGAASWRQELYLSEQTDGSMPNKLCVVEATLPGPRQTDASQLVTWDELKQSPMISGDPLAVMYHPGEINRLRELPTAPHIVLTLTDGADVFVWDVRSQPRRGLAGDGTAPSVADAVLRGHGADAPFALACSAVAARAASGAVDGEALVWDAGAASRKAASPIARLLGHEAAIEDVVWRPDSDTELATTGDDGKLLCWDTRAAHAPALCMAGAHGVNDVHAVDWAPGCDGRHLATGAADGSVRIWDRRRPTGPEGRPSPLFEARSHDGAIQRVEWNPAAPWALASGGEDGVICVWDVRDPDRQQEGPIQKPRLMLQHAGHRTPVVDFQWNPAVAWSAMSVSDDAMVAAGGGTLQLWSISDLLTRPEEQVLAEIDRFRPYISSGRREDLDKCLTKKAARAPKSPKVAASSRTQSVAGRA